MKTMIRMLIATTMVAGLTACNVVDDKISKGEAARTPLSEWNEDHCATNEWYGDGSCDDFCPEEDSDCGEAEEGGTVEPDPVCQPEDCDVYPAIARICEDGSTGEAVCQPQDDGSCGISLVCPEDDDGDSGGGNDGGGTGEVCADDACGPQPAIGVVCEDGSAGDLVCEPIEDGECGWVGSCPTTTDECTPDECGPAPGAAPMCDNGSTGQYECSRNDQGTCGYQLVCGCDDAACGPAPGIPSRTCEDGSVAGPRCVSIGDDACGWNVTDCPE